jgi:hypothetical protein
LNTISWELSYREKSNLSNFRIIKLLVYYYDIEIETGFNRRIKSDSRARQTRLIGYSKGSTSAKV